MEDITDHNKNKYDLLDRFKGFTDGVRVLFLIQRSKEGGKTTKIKKIITINEEEYAEVLCSLLAKQYEARLDGVKLRIYGSVNKRDINNAIREFKTRQLEADYYDTESRDRFYYDVKNRFISSLMAPSSRSETKFILDVDRKDIDTVKEEIHRNAQEVDTVVKELLTYETKSGYHIITEPFNPAILEGIENVQANKDGLLLLSYY